MSFGLAIRALSSKSRLATGQTRTRDLSIENLEDRCLPAAVTLVIDYTPDTHAGGLVDTFLSTRAPNGSIPKFLDFDRNGTVNARDAELCAAQVTSRVSAFFRDAAAGLSFSIVSGDVTSNTGLGTQSLARGRRTTGELVEVMYVGGTSPQSPYIVGRAPEAPAGTNIEGFGEAYSRSLARCMAYKSQTTSTDFANSLAQTIAHEFGHMLGLSHPAVDTPSNVMDAIQPSNPNATAFLNQSLRTANGAVQNALAEVRASLAGQQRQLPGVSSLGGRASHVDTLDDLAEDLGTDLGQAAHRAAIDAAFADLGRVAHEQSAVLASMSDNLTHWPSLDEIGNTDNRDARGHFTARRV